MTKRMTVREARKNLSHTLNAGATVSIATSSYGQIRGFIVGIPEHRSWDQKEKRAAAALLKTATRQARKGEPRLISEIFGFLRPNRPIILQARSPKTRRNHKM